MPKFRTSVRLPIHTKNRTYQKDKTKYQEADQYYLSPPIFWSPRSKFPYSRDRYTFKMWHNYHIETQLNRLGLRMMFDELATRLGRIRLARLKYTELDFLGYLTHTWDPENPQSTNNCAVCGCRNPIWDVLSGENQLDQQTAKGWRSCLKPTVKEVRPVRRRMKRSRKKSAIEQKKYLTN